jgi:hypothetical protein
MTTQPIQKMTPIAEPQSASQAPRNPFATRFVRPGAMPFLFPLTIDVERLSARLIECRWRGAIIGPHGSGKSTLLAELRPALIRAGRRIVHFSLHDGERRLPEEAANSGPWDAATIVIVDGYEQLSEFSRGALDRQCRRAGSGLVVTSHGQIHLPELYRTRVDLELLHRIVDRLTCDDRRFISDLDIEQAFCLHGQNAREAFFLLYDLHERRWREAVEQV